MAPSRLRHSHGASDESKWRSGAVILVVAFIAAFATFFVLSPLFQADSDSSSRISDRDPSISTTRRLESLRKEKAACCRGIEHQELWGSVVAWGSSHKKNSSTECCKACKMKCPEDGADCKCNSWVFCGDRTKCGSRFGECWLKNQDDPLSPDVQDSSSEVFWTSGLVYGRNMGIVQFETEYGAIRIKLLPDCAPLSVAYIIELLKLRHCAGCNFYRAETRGDAWDSQGNPTSKNSRALPYGFLQGTLEAEGLGFKSLPREACPTVTRGMVGWIDGGPDFFISLANHKEWYPKHTVFAKVVQEDMDLVEKLANLPTTKTVWNKVGVQVLEKPISLRLTRTTTSTS